MEFVVDALPVELIGMNSGMMCNYIKFCADRLLLSLGCDRHYRVGNPFEWMETISLQGKTNFFEKRVGEYFKSGVGVDRVDQSFALDASLEKSEGRTGEQLYTICQSEIHQKTKNTPSIMFIFEALRL